MASTSPLLESDDTLAFGEEDEPKGSFRHPVVCFFHVLFRSLAVIVYLLCGRFDVSFIGSFVTCLLLLSMDFWTVKNITGRLMVGLRWWNYIDEAGKSHWVFEAKKGPSQARVAGAESQLFWAALVAFPCVWAILFLVCVFTFSIRWVMLVIIALSLSCSNLWGFVRCRVGGGAALGDTVKGAATALMRRQVLANMTSYFSKSPPTASTSNSNI